MKYFVAENFVVMAAKAFSFNRTFWVGISAEMGVYRTDF